MTYRWHGKKPEASHADDWLMTYADLITLLLCFFAIFMIVSTAKKNAATKEPVHAVVEEVKPPPPVTPPAPIMPQMVSPLPAMAPEQKRPDILEGDLPFRDQERDEPTVAETPAAAGTIAPTETNAPSLATDPPAVAAVQLTSPALPSAIPPSEVQAQTTAADASPPPSLPSIADHLNASGNAHFEQKGDRLTTLEVSSATFFNSGSSVLNTSGLTILRDVAATLKSDQLKDYQVTVEGHTDDQPIHTAQFPSNWELSTARASAVVHFFIDQGVSPQKLRAAGYADSFPKAPNRDADGHPLPANQALNRRVVIKLEKIEKN